MQVKIRPVVGHESTYMISSGGQVFSKTRQVNFPRSKTGLRTIRGRWLKITKPRYAHVSLGSKHTALVHRLVAEAFIPNPDNKPQVNHLNGNKLDNRVSNLEWTTSSENHLHARKNNLNVNPKGEKCRGAKLKDIEVVSIRKLWSLGGYNQLILANMFKVDQSTISKIVNLKERI